MLNAIMLCASGPRWRNSMRKPMTKLGNGMLCSLPVVMLVWTVLVTPARAQFGQQAKLVGRQRRRPERIERPTVRRAPRLVCVDFR